MAELSLNYGDIACFLDGVPAHGMAVVMGLPRDNRLNLRIYLVSVLRWDMMRMTVRSM